MAKVETLEFTIGGDVYSSNINVGKSGIFTINLNWQVAEVLGIESTSLSSKTLQELKTPILQKYRDYINAETKREAFIEIIFKANGYYSGIGWKDSFKLNALGEFNNTLQFNYKLYIKETINDNDVWYSAFELKDKSQEYFKKMENLGRIVCGLEKGSLSFGRKNGVIIPYSTKAVETLNKGKEGLKNISNILYDFLSSDPELIEQKLLSGKLIN